MKRDWTSRTTLLIVGLILVVLNLVGLEVFGRLDLTDDQVYSLSDASIDLVRDLDDPITITAFFTDDLPAPYSTNRRFLKDKLDDYRAYGGQRVQYRFVDPASDEDLEEEASRYGIPPLQIQVVERDNVQLKNAFMGVALEYGGKRESIPVVQDVSTLEYDLTSTMRRLTREELPIVGFLTGHGEPQPASNMRTLYQGLERNYQVRTVTIDSAGTMEPKPEALFIVAPSDSLPEAHLRAIDEYVMGGGRLAVFLNRVDANLQMGQAMELSTGLEGLLERYGAPVLPNLVMDEQSSVVTMQRQAGLFSLSQQIRYPFFPIATRFASDNMMVSRLGDVVFYFVSAVDVEHELPEGVEREALVFSSPNSATQEGFFMIQPDVARNFSFSEGPFPLVAAYRGSFPSAYGSDQTSLSTRLLVAGDGDFINESIVGRIGGNIELGLNAVDWLLQDDALLAIRTKSIEPRALADVSESLRPWIKYGNMLGPVLLVVIFGLWRWRWRKNRQIALVRETSERRPEPEAVPA